MARPVPIAEPPTEDPVPKGYEPAYFLVVPALTYKAISDAAAKRNMTLAALVSAALSEYLKKSEGD